MSDDYDTSKIIAVIILICLVVGVLFVGGWAYREIQKKQFVKECQNNPTQRYAQECTTKQDCINKCTERLYES